MEIELEALASPIEILEMKVFDGPLSQLNEKRFVPLITDATYVILKLLVQTFL